MIPTTRTAVSTTVLALGALALDRALILGALFVLALAFCVDTWFARKPLRLHRVMSTTITLRNPTPMRITHDQRAAGSRVVIRQPNIADLTVTPTMQPDQLDATLTANRRGKHQLPPVAARKRGPLGLAAWDFTGDTETTVTVYPDVPRARRIATAVRRNEFRESGLQRRGPLGLGTEFEAIRDYLPDDDVRQINWAATNRVGRPMSNQYRVEQDRDVICLIDSGRLMNAPVGDRTRLDAAVDALIAVAYVADEVGDRCGVTAFDREIRVRLATRRRGADAVVQAIYDLEPRTNDSDYELAFRSISNAKRALVVVFTDLLDEAAARSLLDAVPVLSRRHAVIVVSVSDPDVLGAVADDPRTAHDFYRAGVALDVLEARGRVRTVLLSTGARVVEAPPSRLAEAVVAAYLRLKDTARL